MDWLRRSGITMYIAAIVWLAIGVPSVFGFVMLKHEVHHCCSSQDQQDNNHHQDDSSDRDCHCFVHGGSMVIPEPASFPVPLHTGRAEYFSFSIVSPESLALAIEYPPQR